MKCVGKLLLERVALSLPVRGAWIEMQNLRTCPS